MNDASAGGRSSGTELRLLVWQFVRIMVQLENVSRVRGDKRGPSIYREWRTAWVEVDRTLDRLGKTDADAFSDLMMNQEVVLRCHDRTQINEVTRTAENVVAQLDELLRDARGDGQREEDLKYERREMKALVRQLRNLGRPPGGAHRAQRKGKPGGKGKLAGKGKPAASSGPPSRPRRARKPKA
ncbi:MAG: hypothetical protein VW618_02480 [Alphaproteobacteria bacterium]